MMDICGQPLLKRIIDRLNYLKKFSKIILATSTNSADQKLVDLAISEKLISLEDQRLMCLGRVTNAVKKI